MSDDIQDDTQDKLIKAFIQYSKWNERFERFGYKASCVNARAWLSEIRRLCTKRRYELQDKKIELHGNQNEGDETDGDDN